MTRQQHTTRFLLWLLVAAGTGQLAAQQDITALEESALKAAVRTVAPSVVKIVTVGGLERVDDVLIGTGPTTGLVVDREGYIVSSAFNFIQQPASILVTLPGGRQTAAEVVAEDHSRKIVLLKIDVDQPLPVPVAVPPEEMQVGQWAVAVGRTFGEDFPNLSVGILSATNRIWGRAIQTDSKVSPANYGGPLVDVRGRVLGVLVPLSPQEETEVAGSEWYDSGIGFAVPLVDVFAALDRLKAGQNLHRGLLGITLQGRNTLVDPAIVGTVTAGTPAAEAGLRDGDRIVEVDGQPVQSQSHLKFALGRSYAGDTVRLVLQRDSDQINATVTLTDRVEPYDLPWLGLLPRRDAADDGEEQTVVRYVDPDSPAAKAGVQIDDRLWQLDGRPVSGPEQWRAELARDKPGDVVRIGIERGDQVETVEVELGRQPESVPQDLPPAYGTPPVASESAGPTAETGLVKIVIPEESNECVAYVPEDYTEDVPHGVIVWLAAPGEFDSDEMVKRWQSLCEQYDLIVLAPQPADSKRWQPTETTFIRKTLDELMRTYEVDPTRVVVHGHQAGGSLAVRFAFSQREVVHGIAVVDAAVPLRLQVRGNDPVDRLAIYFSWSEESPLAKRIERNVERLRSFKFPVTVNEQDQADYLNDEELSAMVRWVDTLDRL